MLPIFEVCGMAVLQLPVGTVPKSGCGRVRQGPFSGWPRAALSSLGQLVVDLKLEKIRCSVFCCKREEEIQRSSAGMQGGRPCLKEKDKLSFVMQMMSELSTSSTLWWRKTDSGSLFCKAGVAASCHPSSDLLSKPRMCPLEVRLSILNYKMYLHVR